MCTGVSSFRFCSGHRAHGADMKTTALLLATAAAVVLGPAAASAPTTSSARPASHFSHPKANPYFPLRPGTVTTYRGTDEGERLRERVSDRFSIRQFRHRRT